MTPEIGLFCLIIALLTALLQGTYLLPGGRAQPLLAPLLPSASWLQALAVTCAFATLISLRLDSDFTVANVIAHSNLALPTLYKIAGSWGNHEGSMLLWVWLLAGFGVILSSLIAQQGSELPRLAVAVQSLVCAGFLSFILFTSNPFERRFPPPVDGQALNPLLQDIALSIHPPLLYLGYVGFSIVFALAAGALLQGRLERNWAQLAHPWILASWSALTIGIGLGSWWAYRELGWGGFWFWDPVENASLLPWLSGTALLHANSVLKKRGQLGMWVILLSIVTFGLSLLGTFLVRSGVLISVHSFASDPARGFFILLYIVAVIGSALLLFALRGGRMAAHGEKMLPLSREGMIVINNLFLLTACATVLLGTLYPMLAEWATGERLTVGPPYFNATFLPLMAVPLLLAGLTPFMPWKQARLKRALAQARPALLAGLVAILLTLSLSHASALFLAMGFGLAAWLATASAQLLITRRGTRGLLAVSVAHFGAAVLVAGVTGASFGKQESERWMQPGDSIAIAGYTLTLKETTPLTDANYDGTRARFSIAQGGELLPEYRRYTIRKSTTSEADIRSSWGSDLYAVIGESSPDGSKIAVRVYYNPMIGLIWAGFVLMALGGVIAIFQQRGNRADTDV